MPRLREIPKAEAHSRAQAIYKLLFGDRDPVAEPGTATGTRGDWWTVFAGAPDVFDQCVSGFEFYRSPKRKLDPRLRELAQTRVGWARGSQFVFSQHCKASRAAGVGEDKIAAIPHWQIADCYDAKERAVLAYADCLVLQGGRVADGIFAALKAHFSELEILELTYIAALYDLHAVMTKALRLEYDDVPERVVEVAAPDAGGDPMRMVDKKSD